MTQFDYMLLGLLVYEMATGKRPFDDIYSLSTVILAVVHDKVKLNVEADHFLQKHNSPVSYHHLPVATLHSSKPGLMVVLTTTASKPGLCQACNKRKFEISIQPPVPVRVF